jgi:hypothetical protein
VLELEAANQKYTQTQLTKQPPPNVDLKRERKSLEPTYGALESFLREKGTNERRKTEKEILSEMKGR